MKKFFRKTIIFLEKFAGKWWYDWLVAGLAAVDAFILMVSIEAFLVPSLVIQPKRWMKASLLASLGSAIGATSCAYLVGIYGEPLVNRLFPKAMGSSSWIHMSNYLQAHGGPGLTLVALGPFPQHIGVIMVGLAQMNLKEVFLAVFVGRTVKYLFFSWIILKSPHLLKKLGLVRPAQLSHDNI